MDLKGSMAAEKQTIHIVGAGLAGAECAYQLAELGYNVVLIEMREAAKPETFTPAHKTADFAELVCSNSFGSLASASAPGELKWEAEQMGSLIVTAAFAARVPAGQALSMDRERFAAAVTKALRAHPRIHVVHRAITSLDDVPRPCVIATGPLTHESLAQSLKDHFGEQFLYFFDAIAPIISADSINTNIAWKADRWDKGTKDYYNCPLTRREYYSFVESLLGARKTEVKEFDKIPYFESCMPIEAMAERGVKTLRFGPMKGAGLIDPRTGESPFAAVQLRQDNKEATAYNMVGFQTKMTYGDQKQVFRMIPGLEEAEFLKLGSMHRNLYINTPRSLNADLSSKRDPLLFFAGQITGVEGYFESTCIGLMVARFLDVKLRAGVTMMTAAAVADVATVAPPRASAMGSLLASITDETKVSHFQPTNINFGAFPFITDEEMAAVSDKKRWGKNEKRVVQLQRARAEFTAWARQNGYVTPSMSRVADASSELNQVRMPARFPVEPRNENAPNQAVQSFGGTN